MNWINLDIIDEEQQRQMLVDASKDAIFDNRILISNRKIFSNSGRDKVAGYCCSHPCKSKIPPTYSANMAPYVNYYCVDCLAHMLCKNRSTNKGVDVALEFVEDIEDEPIKDIMQSGSIQVLTEKFEIEVKDNKIYIDHKLVQANFVDYLSETATNNNMLCKKLIVFTKCINLNKCRILGSRTGFLRGRQFCKNIYLGKPCLSLDPEYKPRTFLAKSVPLGVPGWSENTDPKWYGMIFVSPYCQECNTVYLGKPLSRTSLSIQSAAYVPINYEIKCAQYELKIAELLDEIKLLIDDNTKLTEDNSKLRIESINRRIVDVKSAMIKNK